MDPEIQEYVQQTIQRKLDQFLKNINSSILTEDVNILSNDGEIKGVFRGRGPRRTRKCKPVIQGPNIIDLRPTLFLNNMLGSEILNEVHDAPIKEDANRESLPSVLNVPTSTQSGSSAHCIHYIQWSNTCPEINCEDKASSNNVQTQNKTLLCNGCLNPIPQVSYCGHSMCGKNSVVCANCLLNGVLKCQNLASLPENSFVVVPQLKPSVASYQASERILPEYPYRNPYEKVDHESINTVNSVGEMKQPLNFNRVPVVIDSNNYSGYESDTMHGGSSPSIHGMQFSPDEYQSPCSTPEHWLQSYRETMKSRN